MTESLKEAFHKFQKYYGEWKRHDHSKEKEAIDEHDGWGSGTIEDFTKVAEWIDDFIEEGTNFELIDWLAPGIKYDKKYGNHVDAFAKALKDMVPSVADRVKLKKRMNQAGFFLGVYRTKLEGVGGKDDADKYGDFYECMNMLCIFFADSVIPASAEK